MIQLDVLAVAIGDMEAASSSNWHAETVYCEVNIETVKLPHSIEASTCDATRMICSDSGGRESMHERDQDGPTPLRLLTDLGCQPSASITASSCGSSGEEEAQVFFGPFFICMYVCLFIYVFVVNSSILYD